MKEQIIRKIGMLAGSVNLDDKLYLNRWKTDGDTHLSILDNDVCAESCPGKHCTFFCPAGVYAWQEGRLAVAYEGCLECGACRVGCPRDNIRWRYPRGGFGIQFRLA